MRCSNCETEFDEGFICPACGMKFEEDRSHKDKKLKSDFIEPKEIFSECRNNRIYCQHCGKSIENELNFCPYCGTEIVLNMQYDVKEKSTQRASAKRKRNYFMVIITIILFTILLLGFLLFLSGKRTINALMGHASTLTSIKEDEDGVSQSDGLIKDLFTYVGYAEDELIEELGYEKNEYGCYPDDSHINFLFLDGKMNMIAVNSPVDIGYTIFGVSLNSSLEEANIALLNMGFVMEETYETPRGSIVLYRESNTGFSFSIEANQKDVITGLSYKLEKEDLISDYEDITMIEDEKIEFEEQNINIGYETWSGEYVRDIGPCGYLNIWSIDETDVWFAMGIGNSGALSYRDMRDCNAKWLSDTVAAYEEWGKRIVLTFETDGSITVEEEGIDNDMLSMSGLYVRVDSVDLNIYGFVLKDSNQRFLTENDLKDLGAMECKIARNEIYARHGRMFADEQLQNYFDSCEWYKSEIPAEDFELDLLSDIERENAELISAYEEKMGYK